MSRTEHADRHGSDASAERHASGYSRRLLRALLSALIPGAGQITAGARRRGFVMLATTLLLLICGIAIALHGVDWVLSYLLQPSVLLMLLALNLVLLTFRLFAVIDAYRAGAIGHQGAATGSALQAGVARGVLALLLLLTAAPHGIAGYYTYISHDLLTGVFGSEGSTELSTTSGPPSTTVLAPTLGPTSSTGTTSTTQVTTTTESIPDLEWGADQRLTVLLIGTDAGYGRAGVKI